MTWSTHRFYEFTVVHQVPLVFDLVGCHPRLDLVSETLEDQKKRNGGSQSGGGRKREGGGHMQRLVFNRRQILMETELKQTLPLAERDDI